MWPRKKNYEVQNSSIELDYYLYIRGSRVSINDIFSKEYTYDNFRNLLNNITLDEFYNISSCVLDFFVKQGTVSGEILNLSPFVTLNFSSFFRFFVESSRHALEAADEQPDIDFHNRERLEATSKILFSFLEVMMALNSNKEQNSKFKIAYSALNERHEKFGFRSENWNIINQNNDKWELHFIDAHYALQKDYEKIF